MKTKASLKEMDTEVRRSSLEKIPIIESLFNWRIGRTLFSALATIVFIIPAFCIMLGLAILYKQVSGLHYIKYALTGVVGLLIVKTYKLGKSSVTY